VQIQDASIEDGVSYLEIGAVKWPSPVLPHPPSFKEPAFSCINANCRNPLGHLRPEGVKEADNKQIEEYSFSFIELA